MKPIICSGHAYERMQERHINREQVEATIRTSTLKEPAKQGRIRASKQFGNRVLKVFYKETTGSIIFVTAYWGKQ